MGGLFSLVTPKTSPEEFDVETVEKMNKRYFSLAEANAMIPELEEAFHRMMQLQSELRKIYRRLDAADFAPEGDDFDLDPPGASLQVRNDLGMLKGLMGALRDQVVALLQQGAMVKSVESGLVDWFSRKDERDIFLCWRMGEKEVSHWHDIDTGYDSRRPVSELDDARETTVSE